MEVENNSCFLQGTILGKKARFLIDTGASMSIITKSALADIPGNHKLSSTRTTCRTADGTEVKIYGLELEIEGVNFPLTLYVTGDGMTNTGILGLDHMLTFGAKMDFSSEPFHLTLSSRKRSMVRRLEKCSESAPHTLSLMSETLLEPSGASREQTVTVIIPASVPNGEYRIRLTKLVQETYPHIRLKDTATTIVSSNTCMQVPIWNNGNQIKIPAMTAMACIYAVNSIRVLQTEETTKPSTEKAVEDCNLDQPKDIETYVPGDQVLITAQANRFKWVGPLVITGNPYPGTYTLKWKDSGKRWNS
jgi:predicted aspartyl protease